MAGPWERYQTQGQAGPWQKYAAPAPAPDAEMQQPESGMNERAHVATGGFLEGLPVVGPLIRGGADRIGAGIRSYMYDTPYEDELSFVQGRSGELKQEMPTLDTASQIGGAVGGTIPLVLAAPAAFGAGGGSLLARSGASALSGASLATADAGVRTQGDIEAMKNAALWGGGLGLVGPAVGDLVGAGVRKVAERAGPTVSRAQRLFGQAAGRDAVDDVAARVSAMGPDAMPMDLGPNLQRQAGALAASPGRGQEITRSAIQSRQAGSGGRIAGALDDALGAPVDTVALADDIIAQRSAAAKPLYNAAYSKPVPFTQELENLLKRPSVGRAMQSARRLAADDETFSAATRGWFANVADDGAVTITRTPSVYELDMTKRALDDMYSTAQRAGNNNEARIFDQLRKKLIGFVDDAVPEYKQARAAFSGPASVLDSLEEGQKVFSRNLTPSQLRTQMMKMGDAEKDAFVQGARAEIAKTMGTARNDALAARSLFDKGWNKEKLGIILGDDQASRLLNSLDAETTFTRTRDVVTGNSETAARLAAQSDVGAGAKEPGLFRSFDLSKPGDAIARGFDKVTGKVSAARQAQTNEELARLLTSRDPKAITRTIQLVQNAARRGDISAQQAKQIVQGVTLGSAQPRQPLELTVRP